jgi:hypothetical protein
MKRYVRVLPMLLLLAACSKPAVSDELATRLENPLYAERYYDSLVDFMADLVIQNDPLTKDSATNAVIEKTRVDSLKLAQEATQKQSEGMMGVLVSDGEYVIGEVLLVDNTLYLGPDFETLPGPNLHAYMSTVVDPREGTFPDSSAVDLGLIGSAFGAHSYDVPKTSSGTLKTLALYDTQLKRLFGFAQLNGR